MKKHDSCNFLPWQWQLRTRRPIHIGGTTYRSLLHLLVGAKVPRSKSSRVRKFHTWNFRSRERMVLGAKSP